MSLCHQQYVRMYVRGFLERHFSAGSPQSSKGSLIEDAFTFFAPSGTGVGAWARRRSWATPSFLKPYRLSTMGPIPYMAMKLVSKFYATATPLISQDLFWIFMRNQQPIPKKHILNFLAFSKTIKFFSDKIMLTNKETNFKFHNFGNGCRIRWAR